MRFSILLVFALLISGVSFTGAYADAGGPSQAPAHSSDGKWPLVHLNNDQAVHHTGHVPQYAKSAKAQHSQKATSASAEYLTRMEKKIILEINMVRTNPAEYARMFLVPLGSYYHNRLLQFPGEIAISTKEGIRALDQCIKELQAAKPLSPLDPKKGLTLAARDHAKDQEETGETGHTGSDRSTAEARINRYGKWGITAGENIDYGSGDAKRIVTSLLIDDGVPSRGHRRNLLNGSFKFVGVAVGTHRVFRNVCVMDFAGSYR